MELATLTHLVTTMSRTNIKVPALLAPVILVLVDLELTLTSLGVIPLVLVGLLVTFS